MTGRVEKAQHGAACSLDLIGANVLRDAPCFASDNLGIANRVQQRSLAVVNVAHDGDYRWSRDQGFVGVDDLVDHILHISIRHTDNFMTKLLND